jgi:hypothetical protein
MSFLERYNPEAPIIAVDTETGLFKPGMMAPPLVCVSYAEGDSDKHVGLLGTLRLDPADLAEATSP